jgi:hypothetical protein
MTDEERAVALFRAFHEREPRAADIVAIRAPQAVAMRVGSLIGVIYRIDGERQPLIHKFTRTDRPLLFVSSDGRQIYSVRGRYRFTDRGFVG